MKEHGSINIKSGFFLCTDRECSESSRIKGSYDETGVDFDFTDFSGVGTPTNLRYIRPVTAENAEYYDYDFDFSGDTYLQSAGATLFAMILVM